MFSDIVREAKSRTFCPALHAMILFSHVLIQVIEFTVGFLAAIPAALVYAITLFGSSIGTLVLGRGDERINLFFFSPTGLAKSRRTTVRSEELCS
jgi:hypothetical protein